MKTKLLKQELIDICLSNGLYVENLKKNDILSLFNRLDRLSKGEKLITNKDKWTLIIDEYKWTLAYNEFVSKNRESILSELGI